MKNGKKCSENIKSFEKEFSKYDVIKSNEKENEENNIFFSFIF